MAKGIRIKGSNGIQIDNDYVNYTAYETGTVDLVEGDNYVEFTPTTDTVLFGVSPTTSGVVMNYGITISGSYFTSAIVKSSAIQTVNYGVFVDNATPTITGTVGMKIYKTDGTVAFDSRNKYFKVVDIHNITTGVPEDVNIDVVSADNYFIVSAYYYINNEVHAEPVVTFTWNGKGVKKIDSDTVAISNVILYEYTDTTTWNGGFGSSGGSSIGAHLTELEEIN